jgi:lysophospholipase L1-like esterase
VVLALISPLVFLGGLEIFFLTTGMFRPPELLVARIHEGKRIFTVDPQYGRLFLQRTDVPPLLPLWIPAEKPPGTRRVVLLGESAAAGYPMSQYDLGRMLQARWNARFPGSPLEVVNLSLVAINSHALRDFAREAAVLQPDAFVVYAGHNEVVGPFGPAAKFGPAVSSPELARLALAVRKTRIGQALERLVDSLGPSFGKTPWKGLEEFQGVRVAHDDPALNAMLANTGANFRAIVDTAKSAGAKVLIVLPAVNLEDWPPLASEPPDEGGVEAVLAAQDAGDFSGFRSAVLIYEAARKRDETGRRDLAWPLYRRALDLDQSRIRADSRVRGIQSIIAESSGGTALALDADAWLHEENPRFAGDREFFHEHVHLTFAGRAAVAELMADGLAALWNLAPRNSDAEAWWAKFPEVEGRLRGEMFFTGYDEHDMWSLVWKLLRLEVFSDSPGLEQRRAEIAAKVAELQSRALAQWDSPALIAAYETAMRENPGDAQVHFTAGRLFGMRGEWTRADEAFARGFRMRPNDTEGHLNHAAFQLQRGRTDLARRSVEVLKEFGGGSAGVPRLEAQIAMREGDRNAAARHLREYLQMRPEDEEARKMLEGM